MDLAAAYVLAYSLAYFATGIHVKNPILKYPGGAKLGEVAARGIMFLIGSGLLVAALTKWWFVILPLALFEAWSVMLQWWHVIVWRIPGVAVNEGESSPIHQVSMCLTNLACGVALLTMLEAPWT